jgi:hypothetical protein
MPSLALGFRLKQGRRDQENGDLADLLERSQHVSGLPAKLPDGEPRKQKDMPSTNAATTLGHGGCPAPLESPSERAGGTRRIKARG